MRYLWVVFFMTNTSLYGQANNSEKRSEKKMEREIERDVEEIVVDSDLDESCEDFDHTISFPKNKIHIQSKCERSMKKTKNPRSVFDAISSGNYSVYGELSQVYSNIDSKDLTLNGFKLGLHDQRDNVFSLVYYKSFKNPELIKGESLKEVGLEYGGLAFGGLGDSDDISDVYVGLLVGAGRVHFKEMDVIRSSNPLFILEPEIGLSLQLSRYLQISLGASYRWASGLNSNGLNSRDIKGTNVALRFRIGQFY